jgi:hypothetical protein
MVMTGLGPVLFMKYVPHDGDGPVGASDAVIRLARVASSRTHQVIVHREQALLLQGARRDRDLLGIPHVLHSRRLRSRTGESPLAGRSILDRIKHQMPL